jgi:AraC-like DNA-binding protein
MGDLYTIISTFVTGGLLLSCGLIFIFAVVPDNPLLGNYRKARYTMAFAYLFFILIEIVKYLFGKSGDGILLIQAATLVISASQAFLFTLVLSGLIEIKFPGRKFIFREAFPVVLFISTVIAVYVFYPETVFKETFYVFAGIYALLLGRYTYRFSVIYRRFCLRMDNYFSDLEAERLRWIVFSFCAALSIGVMALISAVIMSPLIAWLFVVVFNAFYVYFAIGFINYAHRFHTIECTINSKPETVLPENIESIANEKAATVSTPTIFDELEKRVNQWVANKQFTEKGITIDRLAAELYTNRNYLSTYVNTKKQQTFREWINQLRIEEAKRLLLQNPETAINEIALQVGFSDKTNFRRHFNYLTGTSPNNWRKRHLKHGD